MSWHKYIKSLATQMLIFFVMLNRACGRLFHFSISLRLKIIIPAFISTSSVWQKGIMISICLCDNKTNLPHPTFWIQNSIKYQFECPERSQRTYREQIYSQNSYLSAAGRFSIQILLFIIVKFTRIDKTLSRGNEEEFHCNIRFLSRFYFDYACLPTRHTQ